MEENTNVTETTTNTVDTANTVNTTNTVNSNTIPEEYKPLSIGQFIGFSFLFTIPCVGLIITIIFACGAVKNKNLINWARAQLIILGIVVALYVLLLMLGVGTAILSDVAESTIR